jgi:queuine tRNA-ribosyltransferase
VRELGGLHRFQGWNKPILTDSGGFQVFSLSDISTIEEEGVTFRATSTARATSSPRSG